MKAYTRTSLIGVAIALSFTPTMAGDEPQLPVVRLGDGVGTWTNNQGTVTCPGSRFAIELVYNGDNTATLYSEIAGSCPGVASWVIICCELRPDMDPNDPNIGVHYFCVGNEPQGLHCEGTMAGAPFVTDVGPSNGPGSVVAFNNSGSFNFVGTFVVRAA